MTYSGATVPDSHQLPRTVAYRAQVSTPLRIVVNDDTAHKGNHQMIMRLTLISHARTDAVRMARFPADEPLDARGLHAATALAGTVRQADRIWTSPARRTLQTAQALGLQAEIDTELRDQDPGAWTGLSLARVQAEEPERIAAWLSDPRASPPGGESVLQLLARVAVWLEDRGSEPGRTLAITHPAVMRAAVIHAIHATHGSFWRIDMAPLSQVVLSRHAGRWRLQSLGPLSRHEDGNDEQ